MEGNHAHPYNRRQVVAIDVLPDDVLLATFDFFVVRHPYYQVARYIDHDTKRNIEWWQSLVHVCRRWRGLIFGSPRRLNLRLCCTPRTRARMSLDVWPALPLLVQGDDSETSVDHIVPELKHRNRISQIGLTCSTILQIENVSAAMQVPFPELEALALLYDTQSPVLPDSFLGGSAPRLRFLYLGAIPFPGLPKLVLSATHLVRLYLVNIPHSGYISPEAMATCLSVLTSLETLQLGFESPQSCPDQENRHSPPPTRSILPTLTSFHFKGVDEYLEDLLFWIDAPRLYRLSTRFFNDIDFNIPELNQFISRTPKLGPYNEVHLIFGSRRVTLQAQPEPHDLRMVEVNILCQVSDWQLSSLAQICTLSLYLFLTMENLYVHEDRNSPPNWKDDTENTEWLELLLPFTAAKNLYLSKQFSPRIAPALQQLDGGRTAEALPTLQNLFLEGFQPSEPVDEGIGQFISARQLTSRPVAISVWEKGSG